MLLSSQPQHCLSASTASRKAAAFLPNALPTRQIAAHLVPSSLLWSPRPVSSSSPSGVSGPCWKIELAVLWCLGVGGERGFLILLRGKKQPNTKWGKVFMPPRTTWGYLHATQTMAFALKFPVASIIMCNACRLALLAIKGRHASNSGSPGCHLGIMPSALTGKRAHSPVTARAGLVLWTILPLKMDADC
eukprot:1159125-Pelagomonas_calceolata.AAC.1